MCTCTCFCFCLWYGLLMFHSSQIVIGTTLASTRRVCDRFLSQTKKAVEAQQEWKKMAMHMRLKRRELEGRRSSLLQRIHSLQQKHTSLPSTREDASRAVGVFREQWDQVQALFSLTEKHKPVVLHTLQKQTMQLNGKTVPVVVPQALLNACEDVFDDDGRLQVHVLFSLWAKSLNYLKSVWDEGEAVDYEYVYAMVKRALVHEQNKMATLTKESSSVSGLLGKVKAEIQLLRGEIEHNLVSLKGNGRKRKKKKKQRRGSDGVNNQEEEEEDAGDCKRKEKAPGFLTRNITFTSAKTPSSKRKAAARMARDTQNHHWNSSSDSDENEDEDEDEGHVSVLFQTAKRLSEEK
eukprot:m.91298 g.91298  ORF g.91298 m.91298 type:complete len:350 (-) comp12326_c0_seq7:4361-5410(-)